MRGVVVLSGSAKSRFLVLRRYFSQERCDIQPDKRFAGLVGGYIYTRQHSVLSPALAYVDKVFLNGGIQDRISKSSIARIGAMDMFNATFLQSHYSVVYNSVQTKNSIGKEGGLQDESEDASSLWRNVNNHKLRTCIARGVHVLQRRDVSEIFIDPAFDAETAAEIAYLSAFSFDELKGPKRRISQPRISCFTAHLDNDPDGVTAVNKLLSAWDRGRIMGESQNQARRWTEMPSNLFPPEAFANSIKEAVYDALGTSSKDVDTSVTVEIHGKSWLEEHKLGGILGVAKGSTQAPYFVEIDYVGDPSRPNVHIALVGKGVTFDSGGISIKPSAGMSDMRGDMGGAAVIASVITGLIKFKSPINIRAYLPLVENMPDGNAYRPGDVIRMGNGTTVQVDNTDAEGRLILADALYYAQLRNPTFILDVATLTGAISVALGDQFSGLFCNPIAQRQRIGRIWPNGNDSQNESYVSRNPLIIESLSKSGRIKWDPFWHMPTLYGNQLREGCATADISNITGGAYGRLGGASSAAAFLQHFVSTRIPYVHLDIAGVMKIAGEDPCMRRGMTGRPTRSLLHFFDYLARQATFADQEE